jgi:hypothetical protein
MLAQAVEVASIYERARAELSGLWTHSTLATALDLQQTEADELISV